MGDFFHPPCVRLHLRHKSQHRTVDFGQKQPHSLVLGAKGGESGKLAKSPMERPGSVQDFLCVTNATRASPAPPRAHPKGPETKNWPWLQLFCDWGLLQSVKTQIDGAKPQMDNRTVACLRFTEAKKSPQSQKSCKNAQIFVFAIENRRNEQTPAAHRPLASHDNAALRRGRHRVQG